MPLPWTPAQTTQLQQLVGLPLELRPETTPAHLEAPLAEVSRILELPLPAAFRFAHPERWIMGGLVLRWLRRAPLTDADIDLFSPSPARLDRSARELLADGARFRCFRTRLPFCPLCGEPSAVVGSLPSPFLPLPLLRCPRCGEVGRDLGDRITAETLLPITAERVARTGLVAVELASAQGEFLHLATATFAATPQGLANGVDFSLAQFATDGQSLFYGRHSWTDLLLGRNRVLEQDRPFMALLRMKKYQALGFRPYPKTWARVWLKGLPKFVQWRLGLQPKPA
jgi:hypothetical protein